MNVKCPRCGPYNKNIKKCGSYFRKSDSQKIQRYFCNQCKLHFSSATLAPNYRQNKRRLNLTIFKLFASGVSQRRMALILGINRKTVARKLKVLAMQARRRQELWLEQQCFSFVQFDDLETIEHTKLKPVSVTMVVNEDRKIVDYVVSRIPAKGHLAKRSRKKYGIRKNEAPLNRERLFARLTPRIHPLAIIESDEHPHYPDLIKKYFPRCDYQTYLSKRSCSSGQGELKRVKFDPLFRINHSFAMLRYSMSRLIRKTWCTTKCLQALDDHLAIYIDYHNRILT